MGRRLIQIDARWPRYLAQTGTLTVVDRSTGGLVVLSGNWHNPKSLPSKTCLIAMVIEAILIAILTLSLEAVMVATAYHCDVLAERLPGSLPVDQMDLSFAVLSSSGLQDGRESIDQTK